MFPALPRVLEQKVVSMVEMLPGIPETAETKQQLFDLMKPSCRNNAESERCLARKDLPGGRFCVARVNCYKGTKRPRGGEPKTTYSFYVAVEVYRPRVPAHPNLPDSEFVGTPYRKFGDDVQDADALWTAVCEAHKVQRGAPENLCVHCWERLTWAKTDTCITCALGVQGECQARGQFGMVPRREADRKTPRPRSAQG